MVEHTGRWLVAVIDARRIVVRVAAGRLELAAHRLVAPVEEEDRLAGSHGDRTVARRSAETLMEGDLDLREYRHRNLRISVSYLR